MKVIQRILLVLMFLAFIRLSVFAQTPIPSITLPEPVMTKNDYVLPYPGILPDHPLYVFKQLRDRILDFLIVDPLRKVEFYILQADKRLGMGIALFAKKNDSLASDVIEQGEHYFLSSLSLLEEYRKKEKEIPGYLVERFERSMDKHEELLTNHVVIHPEVKVSLETVKKTIEDIAKFRP